MSAPGPVPRSRNGLTIPTGPATIPLLSRLRTVEHLWPDVTSQDAVVDTVRDTLRLTVVLAKSMLRRRIFIPSGSGGATRATLRSIRSGSSTNTAASGTSDADRLAEGGWASARGARTYLERAIRFLAGTPIHRLSCEPTRVSETLVGGQNRPPLPPGSHCPIAPLVATMAAPGPLPRHRTAPDFQRAPLGGRIDPSAARPALPWATVPATWPAGGESRPVRRGRAGPQYFAGP